MDRSQRQQRRRLVEFPELEAQWPNGVPAAGDNATINYGGQFGTISISSDASVDNLEITGPMAFTGGGSLTVAKSFTVHVGVQLQNSGTLNLNGTFTGDFVYSLYVNGWTVNNSGVINLGSDAIGYSGYIQLGKSSSVLNNQATGTINLDNGNINTSLGTFNNAGALKMSNSASGNIGGLGGVFNNTGTIDVQYGTMTIQYPAVTNSRPVNVGAGATLKFRSCNLSLNDGSAFTGDGLVEIIENGLTTLNANVTARNLIFGHDLPNPTGDVSGTLQGSYNLTIIKEFDWTGGTLSGNGSIVINPLGIMRLLGPEGKTLVNRSINNTGHCIYAGQQNLGIIGTTFNNNTYGIFDDSDSSSYINISMTAGAVFNNDVGAHFTVLQASLSGDGTSTFNNAGTLSSQGQLYFYCPFYNSGTVGAVGGSLVEFVSGGQTSGQPTFNADQNSLIEFTGGTYTIATATNFQGAGVFVVYGGTLAVNVASTIQNFGLRAGTLSGVQPLSCPGVFTWTGGKILGSSNRSAAVYVGVNGMLSILGGAPAQMILAGRLDIFGKTIWSGGDISAGDNALFANVGSFEAQAQGGNIVDISKTVQPQFKNIGSFTAEVSNGAADISFENRGVFRVNAGISFNFSKNYTQNSQNITNVADNAVLSCSNFYLNGGTVTGTGTISVPGVSGIFQNASSQQGISPGNSPGLLTVSGHYRQTVAGALKIEIGGYGVGTGFDQLVTGNAGLGGALNISLINGFLPSIGDSFQILKGSPVTDGFRLINGPLLVGSGGAFFLVNYDFGGKGVTLTLVSGTGGGSIPQMTVVAKDGSTRVIGSAANLRSNSSVTIQLYEVVPTKPPIPPSLVSNATCDPSSSSGILFGSTSVTTDGSGNASFDVSFPVVIPAGAFVTAVAIDSNNQGTPFSPCTQVIGRTMQLSATTYEVNEADGGATITVNRTGDTSVASSVDYATSDGSASQASNYTTTVGTLNFAPGETSKTFTIPVTNNAYVEGPVTVNIALSNPSSGSDAAIPSLAVLTIDDNDTAPPATNPLDNADERFFVRQHYYDFLNRLPDQAGFDYWTGQITQCGANQTCINSKRIDVSNAFFFEQEYQQTGAYVFRLYRAAYGNNQPFPNPDASNQTDLRSAISKSAGHDAELQQKLVRIVEQAETSAVRGNKAQAARNLNSITMTVFSTPESRLSKEQKVSIMVALDKSWREFRLVGRKAHVRRDGHCCNLQKGRGRCLPDSEDPDNVCFEGQNARGQWSCISNKPCPGQ